MINRSSTYNPTALAALALGAAGLFALCAERHRANVIGVLAVETRIAEIVLRDDEELLEVYPPCDDGSTTTKQDVVRSLLLGWERVARVAGVTTRAELRSALDYYLSDPAMRAYWTRHGTPDLGGFDDQVNQAANRTLVKSGPERAAG